MMGESSSQSGRCIELALEGERLCRSGDTQTGIQYLELALTQKTDDLRTLSAIYSQLGNAYFYLRDYEKALEYHRHDLTLASAIKDAQGEGKASGNLGNTLKVLGKFNEAIICCQRHLKIAHQLNDKVSEARALYNLGNVHHAKGKLAGRTGRSSLINFSNISVDSNDQVHQSLTNAVVYYEANLKMVKSFGDKAAIGRACGNLGNTHYLMGHFDQAIEHHLTRLSLAKEFGDKAAMRRAFSNLANAHIFLGQVDIALEYYRKALTIAVELRDRATEAQTCYSLGNSYTLMGRHDQAVEYHLRHLSIARELHDCVGESRASFSLSNAFKALGQRPRALYFAILHYKLANQMHDENGESAALNAISDLRFDADSDSHYSTSSIDPSADPQLSMTSDEASNLIRWTSSVDSSDVGVRRKTSSTTAKSSIGVVKRPSTVDDGELFFDLISRMQSKRIDDQRCDVSTLDGINSINSRTRQADCLAADSLPMLEHQTPDDFLDMIVGMQSRRMDDQRARLEFLPGLQHPDRLIDRLKQSNVNDDEGTKRTTPARDTVQTDQLDDDFFDMIARSQSCRLEDQRSDLPVGEESVSTVPEDDIFQLVNRMQTGRFEEQRADFETCFSKGSKEKKMKKKYRSISVKLRSK